MKEDKLNKMFEFMLKEYEMLYSKFEMHYNAVEKTIGLYLIIIGAIISANGFFIKDYCMSVNSPKSILILYI